MGLLFGCSALHGKDNAISDVERGDGTFVPFIFPWFQYLLTNRNNLLTIRNMCAFSPVLCNYFTVVLILLPDHCLARNIQLKDGF